MRCDEYNKALFVSVLGGCDGLASAGADSATAGSGSSGASFM